MASPLEEALEQRIRTLEEELLKCKRAQEVLRESGKLYTKLVDTIPNVIVRTDLEGNILFVNNYTLQISGYSREEIEGQSILTFVSPEDRDRLMQNIRLMLKGRLGPQEYQMLMKDGRSIPCEMNGDVLLSEDGAPFGLVNVCVDLTDRKRAQEAFHYQGKIQGVLEMAGSICHEMNQPIQGMSGFIELISLNISQNDPNRENIEAIRRQIDRITIITKKLLTIKDYKSQDYPGGKRITDINKTFG